MYMHACSAIAAFANLDIRMLAAAAKKAESDAEI